MLLTLPNGASCNVFSPFQRLNNPGQELPEGLTQYEAMLERRYTISVWRWRQTDVTMGYVGSIVWWKIREEGEGQVDIHKTIVQFLCLINAITADLFKLTHIIIGRSVYLLDSFLGYVIFVLLNEVFNDDWKQG